MRKNECIYSAMLFCFLCIMAMSANAGTVAGDIDGDDKVGVKEAIHALQSTSGLKPAVMFTLQSDAFADGAEIPDKHACCGGENISPQLTWSNPPAGTMSFVLVMDDPDAVPVNGGKIWDHWIVYDIPAGTSMLSENAGASSSAGLPAGAKHGPNSYTNTCGPNYYGGPCPPVMHRYFFRLYALDVAELAPARTTKDGIDAAMRGHILGSAELMGTYTP